MIYVNYILKKSPNMVTRSGILKADEIVRVSPGITEHHKDEWILQIVYSTVMKPSTGFFWVQRVRLLHPASTFTW